MAEKIRQLKLKDLKMVPHRPGYRGGDTYVCVDHLNEYLRRGNSLPYGATPYVEIFVNENQFAIRRAMGGHLENNCSDEEMAMIRALLEHHGVVVTSWLCSNHGDGMPGNIQKTGDSKQSFIDYLHSVAH